MTSKKLLILTGSFGLWLVAAAWSLAAVQLESLTVGYASFSGHYALVSRQCSGVRPSLSQVSLIP